VVQELPRDPRHRHEDRRDPFAFHRRLQQLVGLPMVIQVRRDGAPAGSAPVDLFVPAAYHYTLGVRMKMGEIAALREGSPAARAGLQKGDLLVKVVLQDDQGKVLKEWGELDPERLPDDLRTQARQHPGRKKVALTVRRPAANGRNLELPATTWDDSWNDDIEIPLSPGAPLSIPQLGLAYRIESRLVEVVPGGPADKAHVDNKEQTPASLHAHDRIDTLCFRTWSSNLQDTKWDREWDLGIRRNGETVYDGWARIFTALQGKDHKAVLLKVSRPDGEVKNPIVVEAQEDESWPLVDRGLKLDADFQLQRADSFGQALEMGARETGEMIKRLYMQLRSLATGRVSAKQVGGPFEMGRMTAEAARLGFWHLLALLGAISINLAVVNFLPIPILDGGHMVFLIYEKLRGRPPSEGVRVVATYIGLAAIACLMIFVFYQDIRRIFF
jgi:regulator of sigma E protease